MQLQGVAPGVEKMEGSSTRAREDASVAFLALLESELPRGYKLAGYLLGDATEAEDAVCEAISRAWQNWARLREPDRFTAWFGRILTNACRDRMRRRHGVRFIEIGEEVGSISDGDPFADALARDQVGRLMRRLSADEQIVLGLRYWQDLRLEEIAEHLGLPLGTVKSRLYKSLKALRAELERQAGLER